MTKNRAAYCRLLRSLALGVVVAVLLAITLAGAHPDPWGTTVISCEAHNGWCQP